MVVGICYTKNNTQGINITNSFKEGVLAVGDNIREIRNVQDCKELSECDVSFQVCEATPHKSCIEDGLRYSVKETQSRLKKRRLILDISALNGDSKEYVTIGFDGIKGHGTYYNTGSDGARRLARNINITERTNNTAGDIVIFGQVYNNFGLAHLGAKKAAHYFRTLPGKIREYTDRRIIYRMHPNNYDHKLNTYIQDIDNIFISQGRDMDEDLKNASCTITRTSMATGRGLLQGIPAICEDNINLAYPVCEHKISNINNPRMGNITQWVNDVCYAEWSDAEILKGLPWIYLKNHLYNYI